MIDLTRASEDVAGHSVRAWTGVATDEGVGLLSMVEVWDGTGRPVCRFEEFLHASARGADVAWLRDDASACRLLQERAVQRARSAVLGGTLGELHGHRFDVDR